MLEQLQKEDPSFESIKAFQHLVKVYTHNSCYYKLGLRFNQGRFTDVQTYTATLLDLTQKHIDKHCYKMFNKPVHRGLNPGGSFSPKDYQLNTVGSWHKFMSTSSEERVVNFFSMDGQKDNFSDEKIKSAS